LLEIGVACLQLVVCVTSLRAVRWTIDRAVQMSD
jgi:hypothetical protein